MTNYTLESFTPSRGCREANDLHLVPQIQRMLSAILSVLCSLFRVWATLNWASLNSYRLLINIDIWLSNIFRWYFSNQIFDW